MTGLNGRQVLYANLPDWRMLARAIHTRFKTGDFATGLELVNAIGAAAEKADHHPDLTLTYSYVDVALMSHDEGAVTEKDTDLARAISALAAERGIGTAPWAVRSIETALDTADLERQGRFWSVLLTGDEDARSGDEIRDADGNLLWWFQGADAHATPRQRFHLDVWLPHDVAELRIEAAVAAGGTLHSDEHAPSYWVLTDPEGNRVCVCTSLDR